MDERPGYDDVHALRRPDRHRRGDSRQALGLGRPDAGRVDDAEGAHVELGTRLEVRQSGAGDPLAFVHEGNDAGSRHTDGAESRRRARQRQREAGVVDLGVVEADAPAERVLSQGRHARERCRWRGIAG